MIDLDGKRYNTLNAELKRVFGEKVAKISIDGGFSCPNRDGKVGFGGCIFCGEKGAGEFTSERGIIKDQASEQVSIIKKKWKTDKFIVYFQNFTNTYAPIEKLKSLYEEALEIPGVVGLAIATRPDCLDEEVMKYLSELNKRTFLWVELGLQSIHDKTSRFIRRGYPLEIYDKAISNLKIENIRIVTHLIIGLPYETREEIIQSIKYVGNTMTWGIKLHSLYIQRDTDLYKYFERNPFRILSKDEYVEIVTEGLMYLPKDFIIHRITGDADKNLLVEPKWSGDKLSVLAQIDSVMKEKDIYQGQNSIL